MAGEHAVHLLGPDEHAAHLGCLVRAAHPALDAGVGAPAGAVSGVHGGHVPGCKAEERVVAVQGRHHDLAHLAVRHRVAGTGPDDLDDHALVQDHAFQRRGLVGDQTHIRRAVVLHHIDALTPDLLAERGEERAAADKRLGERGQGGAHLCGLVQHDLQEVGRAHEAYGAEMPDRLDLLFGLADAAGKHRAAQGLSRALHHEGAGREVVAEGVVHHIALAEAGGVK